MFLLNPTQPFEFAPSLRFIKLNPGASGSASIAPDSILLHAARIQDAAVGLAVSAPAGTLGCEIVTPLPITAASNPDCIQAYLDNYLSLPVDLSGFYAVAEKDKRFAAEVLTSLRGYHPVKFPTRLESMVWAVLSQATPQIIARRLMQTLAATYGDSVQIGKFVLTAFPSAQILADASKGALRDLIASERKAKTIQAAAQALLTVDPAWLQSAPTEFLEGWLRELPGIGAWSSSLILVRGFGRMDAITADSLAGAAGEAFLTAAKRVYGPRFTGARLAAMLEKYGPYGGYWLHYLRAGLAR